MQSYPDNVSLGTRKDSCPVWADDVAEVLHELANIGITKTKSLPGMVAIDWSVHQRATIEDPTSPSSEKGSLSTFSKVRSETRRTVHFLSRALVVE
jgi:hypothetical protein